MNFGYEVQPIPESTKKTLKIPSAQELVAHQLKVLSKSFKWGCKHDDQNVTMEFDLTDERLLVKFNFHSDSQSADKAVDAIKDKVLVHRDFTERILNKVYDLRLEDA